jgi:hypothetical protein
VIDRHIDQGWDDHAAQGRHARQNAPRPAGQLAVDRLALDLQPDQQEEHRHQPVIDPVGQAETADIDVQGVEITVGQRRVGDHQRQGGRAHQQQAAGGLAAQEGAQGGKRAGAGDRHAAVLADSLSLP